MSSERLNDIHRATQLGGNRDSNLCLLIPYYSRVTQCCAAPAFLFKGKTSIEMMLYSLYTIFIHTLTFDHHSEFIYVGR